MWRFRHLDWSSLLLVTPAMTFFSVFVIYPIIQTVWLSLWKWDRISPGVWVGLDNYKKVLTNPEIYSAFSHSLVFVLFYSVIPITIGLFITLLLLRVKVKGETFFRAVLFVPQIKFRTDSFGLENPNRQIFYPLYPIHFQELYQLLNLGISHHVLAQNELSIHWYYPELN